uniref:splicing factor, putative n=1 Tax=Arabidopsis thaliana TaxID=3702 RepID=UPI0000481B2B|nr:Chain A, splicing factor, putative [Arabidopsis thaliana]
GSSGSSGKFDESALVPEDQFLAQHPGPATIRVSKPNENDGQFMEITVQSLSENVGSLKEKIAGEIQIPANKQKLSGKAGFLKDNMSLAHYNVGAGEILTLSLRERSGPSSG